VIPEDWNHSLGKKVEVGVNTRENTEISWKGGGENLEEEGKKVQVKCWKNTPTWKILIS